MISEVEGGRNQVLTCYTLDATPSSVLLTLEKIKKNYIKSFHMSRNPVWGSAPTFICLHHPRWWREKDRMTRLLKQKKRGPILPPNVRVGYNCMAMHCLYQLFNQIIGHIKLEIMQCNICTCTFLCKKKKTPHTPNVQQCCFNDVSCAEIRHTCLL